MHLSLFGGRELGEVFFQQFFQLLRSMFLSVLVSHIHAAAGAVLGVPVIQPCLLQRVKDERPCQLPKDTTAPA
jgi:hypothetical protein